MKFWGEGWEDAWKATLLMIVNAYDSLQKRYNNRYDRVEKRNEEKYV